jgi:glutathione S-transferase
MLSYRPETTVATLKEVAGMLTIYGDPISGNCLKVKWTAERLAIPYTWTDVDVTKAQSRTPAFLALNPAGQVPVVVLADGRTLAQSNAIIFHLAEGSALIPVDAYSRAKMLEWLFWEQYSHEPYVAVCRYHLVYLGKDVSELDPEKVRRGYLALDQMERRLRVARFLVETFSLADIALLAYTRLAHEGGFDLGRFPSVQRWITAAEAHLGLPPAH